MGLARETSSAPKPKNCVHPYIDNTGGSTIHNWGEPERAPHKRYFNARSVYIIIIMVRPSPARRFVYRLSTKAACNVFGCKVCVVKTTATFCSNIASIGLFAIFPSWSASYLRERERPSTSLDTTAKRRATGQTASQRPS